MDPLVTSTLISTGANILGKFFGGGDDAAEKAADANYAIQKEFAKNGIRWRVEDAQRAGIHPLYALGAQTTPGSPVMVDGGSNSNPIGESLAEAGSGIARAMAAGKTSLERLQEQMLTAQIKGQEIDNAKAASDLALSSGAGIGPPGPMGNVKMSASEMESVARGNHGLAASIPAAAQIFRNLDGSTSIWPSKDAKQSIEDSLYEYEHMLRNRVIPTFQDYSDRLSDRMLSTSRWVGSFFGRR